MRSRRRNWLIPTGWLLLACLAMPWTTGAQEQGEVKQSLIAVLDLKVVGGTEVEGVAITNTLREELLKTARYKLINRNQMEAVLEEQALQQVACTGAACVAVGGKVYVIGGEDEKGVTNAVQVFDPAAKKWGRAPDAPVKFAREGVALLDSLVYVTGGHDGKKELITLFVFDPVLNTWAQKAPMKVARSFHGSAALQGKVFVFGGEVDGDPIDGVEEYDPATNTWTPRTKLPRPLFRLSATAQGGKIFLIGGDDGSFGFSAVNLNYSYE